ncbi:MBL fold metallo-hydrolase [Mycolicibacterium sp. P1-18]|uniref:MBL fold metallo-hydrolase n=1 Tax=Mycolicibacterium sp. P1-18 TaxID=2024615 RepID=UPI0011F344AA|nr:MBL fold metallo-hydrolase [Mycolicibacterium sp. P1-18]KAA0092766.1 MBL fold metallo-hydrolase [Mycolicibacterium sp. P1-18]
MSGDDRVQSITLGDVEVIRAVEWYEPFLTTTDFLPAVADDVWTRNADWLAPDHWQPDTDQLVIALQTWVLRSGGRTILVDTGAGSRRNRPGMAPWFDQRESDLLAVLAQAGVQPEDVDVVVNTHLHVDHAGGNTVDADGQWVPAFPNAQYLIPAADDAHYGPDNASGEGLGEVDRLVYADSVAPIHEAGRAVLWDEQYTIDEHLTLESAPGHTPGTAVLRLASGSDRAVFAGDLLHSPAQIVDSCCNSAFCYLPEQAIASRRRILERAADEHELVIPGHFGGAGALEVRRNGGEFALGQWAAFSPASATS